MKKILIAIIGMMLILTSCADNTDNTPQDTTTTTSVTGKNPITGNTNTDANDKNVLTEFYDLFSKDVAPDKLFDFLDREISGVSSVAADSMILFTEELQKVYEDFYVGLLFQEGVQSKIAPLFRNGIEKEQLDTLDDSELKEIMYEALSSGFKFAMVEGVVYPILDYSRYQKYLVNLSYEIKSFLEIEAVESDHWLSSDAALIVPWSEIAKRLSTAENFLNQYPESIRKTSVEYLYTNYLTAFLIGMNNTPAYHYDTNVYKPEVLDAFKTYITENKGKASAQVVQDYLKLLEQNQNKFDDQHSKFVQQYTETLYDLFQAKEEPVLISPFLIQELSELLPEREGFKWIYNGFAEYGHQMTLDNIDKKGNLITYTLSGAVEDMSGGESGRAASFFELGLIYTIENDVLYQDKEEQMMMDSAFDHLELIKFPLRKGTSWYQMQMDQTGENRDIIAEIIDVKEINEQTTYTVLYQDMNSPYYEKRELTTGLGTTTMTSLYTADDGTSFDVSYFLYHEASGY